MIGGRARCLVPWVGAGCVLAAALALAPVLAPDPAGAAALRRGAAAGVLAGAATAFGVGRWLTASLSGGRTAFLVPLACGFLIKLLVLGAGAWLFAVHPAWGYSYAAYALAFTGAAVAWHWLFLLSEPRLRGDRRDA